MDGGEGARLCFSSGLDRGDYKRLHRRKLDDAAHARPHGPRLLKRQEAACLAASATVEEARYHQVQTFVVRIEPTVAQAEPPARKG